MAKSHPHRAETDDSGSRVEIVMRFIKRYILDGRWEQGMPKSEQEIQDDLQACYGEELRQFLPEPTRGRSKKKPENLISRTPIREALAILEDRQLILRGHHGRAQLRQFGERDRADIATLRRSIEPRMAWIAAEQCKVMPAAAEKLTQIWQDMRQAVAKPELVAQYVEGDLAFHSEIARLGSRINGLVISIAIEQSVIGGRRLFEIRSRLVGDIHREHQAIYQAIISGQPEEASKRMTEHLSSARKRSEEAARFV